MSSKISLFVVAVIGMFFSGNTAHAQLDLLFEFDQTIPGNFMDLSFSPEATALGLGDDTSVNFFSTFLGANVAISNNGAAAIQPVGDSTFISFGNSDLNFSPSVFGGSEVFLPFWDDLDSESGDVFVEDQSDRLVIQWNNRPIFPGVAQGPEDGATIQLQIFGRESNLGPLGIIAQYIYDDLSFLNDPFNDNGNSATIGYQSSPGEVLQFSFNEPSVFDGDVLSLRAVSVPEPSSFAAIMLASLGVMRRRRRS